MGIEGNRRTYIDVLKGIGIFLVVFGHITHIRFLREYIWDFHMPLFFWISGMLFNENKYPSFKEFFRSRIKSIYIPYVLFFLITFLYWMFLERKFRGGEYSITHQFLGLIYGTYEGNHLNFNGALWFLPCLFSVEIMFYFIEKVKVRIGIIALLLFSFVIGRLIHDNHYNTLPLGIHTALFGIIFYGIGFLLKNISVQLMESPVFYRYLAIFGFLSIQLLCLGKYSGTIEETTFPYITLALIGIFLYFTLSFQIKKSGILEFLGRNSLIILAFQEQTYRAVIFLSARILSIDSEVIRRNIFYCFILSCVSLLIILPIIHLYNNYVRIRINRLFL